MAAHPIVGFLKEQGYDADDVETMLTPLELYDESAGESLVPPGTALSSEEGAEAEFNGPADRQDALRAILTTARDDRKPPGPQVAVPSGVVNNLPGASKARVVRVDMESSFRKFRRRMQGKPRPSTDTVDRLTQQGQRELMGEGLYERDLVTDELLSGLSLPERELVNDELLGLYERQLITDELLGGVAAPSTFGDGLYERGLVNSELLLGLYERQLITDELLGSNVPCVLCGAPGVSAFCEGCRQPGSRSLALLGLFDRGSAADDDTVLGFGGRGSAADIYGAVACGDVRAVLGWLDSRPQEQRCMLSDRGICSTVVGDILSLEAPVPSYGSLEPIPLTFNAHTRQPDADKHISAWRSGDNIYASVRLTGWDGEPRILTATVPYARSMGVVVGYAERAGVAPALFLGMADGLTRQLGAQQLVPLLCAASPHVLGLAHGRQAPHFVAVAPAWVE